MDDLTGRTAFITGGAQGIGLGIARALAREKVRLAIADVNEDALAAAQEELGVVTETATFTLDVRDRGRFAEVVDEAESRLGAISLVFNNAGVAGGVPVASMSYEMWDWVLGINLTGVVNGIQTFVPRMLERGTGGYIVNTASGAGLVGFGDSYMYITSKFAVVGLSESLYVQLAPQGIGVSVLCPGPVATEIVDNTQGLQPDIGLPASERFDEALARARANLHAGTDPDAVGDMVVAAMRAGQLYIYTDLVMAEPIKIRTQMLLDALPVEEGQRPESGLGRSETG